MDEKVLQLSEYKYNGFGYPTKNMKELMKLGLKQQNIFMIFNNPPPLARVFISCHPSALVFQHYKCLSRCADKQSSLPATSNK